MGDGGIETFGDSPADNGGFAEDEHVAFKSAIDARGLAEEVEIALLQFPGREGKGLLLEPGAELGGFDRFFFVFSRGRGRG